MLQILFFNGWLNRSVLCRHRSTSQVQKRNFKSSRSSHKNIKFLSIEVAAIFFASLHPRNKETQKSLILCFSQFSSIIVTDQIFIEHRHRHIRHRRWRLGRLMSCGRRAGGRLADSAAGRQEHCSEQQHSSAGSSILREELSSQRAVQFLKVDQPVYKLAI